MAFVHCGCWRSLSCWRSPCAVWYPARWLTSTRGADGEGLGRTSRKYLYCSIFPCRECPISRWSTISYRAPPVALITPDYCSAVFVVFLCYARNQELHKPIEYDAAVGRSLVQKTCCSARARKRANRWHMCSVLAFCVGFRKYCFAPTYRTVLTRGLRGELEQCCVPAARVDYRSKLEVASAGWLAAQAIRPPHPRGPGPRLLFNSVGCCCDCTYTSEALS